MFFCSDDPAASAYAIDESSLCLCFAGECTAAGVDNPRVFLMQRRVLKIHAIIKYRQEAELVFFADIGR
jgi:hypothetical protein